MSDSIRIFAPATVANVGSAFDILGFALVAPGDIVVARRTERPGISLKRVSSPFGVLPLDPERNTASVAASELLRRKGIQCGLELEVDKQMPLGSGLGSSAASAAAGVLAAKILFDIEASDSELVSCAMEGERIACGTAHADNVAPSLLGGVILIRSYEPLDIVRISPAAPMYYSVVCPRVEIRTEDARKVLRREVRLKDAVVQMGNVAGLISGLLIGDIELVGRSLKDVLIEPERSSLIPCFESVRAVALESGGLGCGISGSGPSIFALSKSLTDAEQCALAMAEVFLKENIEALSFSGAIGVAGARIVD